MFYRSCLQTPTFITFLKIIVKIKYFYTSQTGKFLLRDKSHLNCHDTTKAFGDSC